MKIFRSVLPLFLVLFFPLLSSATLSQDIILDASCKIQCWAQLISKDGTHTLSEGFSIYSDFKYETRKVIETKAAKLCSTDVLDLEDVLTEFRKSIRPDESIEWKINQLKYNKGMDCAFFKHYSSIRP